MDLLRTLRDMLGIRSPTLEMAGFYHCERCKHHDDCICVVCEEGKTVVCMLLNKHVSRWGTCKDFKPMK